MTAATPTLVVELRQGSSQTTRDVTTLGRAYLGHARMSASWPPVAPTSRELRHSLPGWSRRRFAAALRELAPTLTTRPDGSRHLSLCVPVSCMPAESW